MRALKVIVGYIIALLVSLVGWWFSQIPIELTAGVAVVITIFAFIGAQFYHVMFRGKPGKFRTGCLLYNAVQYTVITFIVVLLVTQLTAEEMDILQMVALSPNAIGFAIAYMLTTIYFYLIRVF